MLCGICNKNEATIHIQEIIGNQKKVLHLCQACAEKKAQEDSGFQFNLAEVLYNISNQINSGANKNEPENEPPSVYDKLFCKTCGWDYSGFRKTGRLGCPDCYKTFYEVLKGAIEAMHRGTVHTGKIPVKKDDVLKPQAKRRSGVKTARVTKAAMREELKKLQSLLAAAIAEERYEDAAALRDSITGLKTKIKEPVYGKKSS